MKYTYVHTHRNLKNTQHWRLSWYRYETFITFLTSRYLTRGERDTQFLLCWLFHVTQQTRARVPRSKQLDSNPSSLRLRSNLNSLLFFKITKNPSPSLPGMTSFTSPALFPIWGFYSDIYDCHILPACAWTTALNVCT